MTALLSSPREAWLLARRELVTASDCAAILGLDERRSAYAVWAEKTGDLDFRDSIDMARGRRFEAVIGEEYSIQTGRPVFPKEDPYEIAIHPDLPWLGATLDMMTVCDPHALAATPARAPLQIKMAIGSAKDWRDEPPTAYLIQVAIEIACARADWGALCALVGPGPLKTIDLERDDAFLALAIPKLEEFHWKVKNRIAPEVDGSDSTAAALKALYATDDGETVELGPEGQALADAWDSHDLLAEAEREQIEAAKNGLRSRIGTATFGRLPDGSYLSLKANKRGHRGFRRFWPSRRSS